MTALAGRLCTIKVGVTPLGMSAEPCTDAGDHLVYTITEATKRAIDPDTAVVVKVTGDTIASTLYAVDYSQGKITFASEYGGHAAGDVTVDGKYCPLFTVAEAKTADVVLPQPQMADGTRLGDSAPRQVEVAKRASVTLTHFSPPSEDVDTTGAAFTMDMVMAADRVFLEVALSTVQTVRGWFAPQPATLKHALDSLLETSLEFRGVVLAPVGRPSTDQALFSLT